MLGMLVSLNKRCSWIRLQLQQSGHQDILKRIKYLYFRITFSMPSIIDILSSLGKLIDTKSGQEKDLRDFRFKYIGLYFTATWCSYCVKIVDKLPQMIAKVNSRGEHLKLITFRLDETQSNFAYSYLRYKSITYDTASQIASMIGAHSIPSIYIYDIFGNLVTKNGLRDIMQYKENTIDVWQRQTNKK